MTRFEWQYLHGFYYVYDRRQGVLHPRDAIARCDKAYDAERIVDALNKAAAE